MGGVGEVRVRGVRRAKGVGGEADVGQSSGRRRLQSTGGGG